MESERAICVTSSMLKLANIETTSTGNKKRIPKTAIIIPQVKNLSRHLWLIFSNFIAFTTALSKERLTSSTDKTNAIKTTKNKYNERGIIKV